MDSSHLPLQPDWKLPPETVRTQLSGAPSAPPAASRKLRILHQTIPAYLIFCSLPNSLICLLCAPADGLVKEPHWSLRLQALGTKETPCSREQIWRDTGRREDEEGDGLFITRLFLRLQGTGSGSQVPLNKTRDPFTQCTWRTKFSQKFFLSEWASRT